MGFYKTGTVNGNRVSPRDKMKFISVELAGGIGNQLFTFIAGIFIGIQLGANIQLFLHNSLANVATAGQGIAAFKGVTRFETKASQSLARSPSSARWRGWAATWLERLGLSRKFSQFITAFFQSSVVGEDLEIKTIRAGYFIRGYFQTRTYYQELSATLPEDAFHLKDPSPWFKQLEHKARLSKPIAVHVRRGDYLDDRNSFIGALSTEYFLEAVSLLKQNHELRDREVWVFSNDIHFAKGEFYGRIEGVVHWIEPPAHSSEAESLLLLGSGEALVMSNSTFSWWAAVLGKPARVVAPSKWFKGADDPSNLLMPEWEKMDSKWI